MVPTKSTVNGIDLHSSLAYHKEFGSTVCLACGYVATQAVRNLATVRKQRLNHYGKQQLTKVQQGLPPGTSKLAKKQVAQKKVLGWKEQTTPLAPRASRAAPWRHMCVSHAQSTTRLPLAVQQPGDSRLRCQDRPSSFVTR